MKNDSHNQDFIEKCRSIDFSSESANKEKNLEILKCNFKNIENEKEIVMNKKIRKPMALIAVVAALICLSAAVYGDELVRIIKTVTLGSHAEYYVMEDKRESVPIPAEIKGMVFDKDGNELQAFPEDGTLYDANGNKVMPVFDDGTVRLMTPEEYETTREAKKANVFTTYDIEEAKSYFICNSLFPEYLPTGYKFDRVEFYGDPTNQKDIDDGTNKYMSVYYSNGKFEMYSQVRYMDEETAFGAGATEKVQQIKINGHDAVLDVNTLDIQIGDVMYMFFTTEDTTEDDLVKMAESLR